MASPSEPENLSPNVYIPEEWSDAAHSMAYDSLTSPPPISLICGAKNSGKTTFSRHLLNILLHSRYSKVAYLDTDVGQPEFTPPGFLSLTIVDKITPDLAIPCLKTPERCHFYGDVSSKRDLSAYLNYIFSLYDHFRKECYMSKEGDNPPRTKLPLIVNTSGWVKGFGYNVLVDMLKYIAPTHVVKICISAVNKNLPAGAFWLDGENDGTVNLIEINSARQDSFNRSLLVQKDARLVRDLRIMAYFRQCFPSDRDITTIKEFAHALSTHRPFEVPIARIKTQHLHCQVPSSETFYSLNASIVGLAIDSEESKKLPWCIGLGIVRGIDTFKGVFFVITPVPQSSLEKVNLFLRGYIQIPTCLLQVQGFLSPYMSANVLFTS
ncbi:polynucleotide 5'-hydroxyl-kinase NOL9 [Senna tora]|uniref:Polynucleotide 5'-hydroxyl-kinase NOL9 n=1 Tax=Senna tora TaxID=362788 RepID=A0A834W1T1_9FABA|nr:polynucleotide 5'-hydroxyl-kinase NOL9 [Senna tora]